MAFTQHLLRMLPPQDEAISVREAAVSLLGRHAASNQALALRLSNTLAKVRGAMVRPSFKYGWGAWAWHEPSPLFES